jgi:hypothetical protein
MNGIDTGTGDATFFTAVVDYSFAPPIHYTDPAGQNFVFPPITHSLHIDEFVRLAYAG